MRIPPPRRHGLRARIPFSPLLAALILLGASEAGAATTALPAGQVSIVRDGKGSRWRCETQRAARAICVRQSGRAGALAEGDRKRSTWSPRRSDSAQPAMRQAPERAGGRQR